MTGRDIVIYILQNNLENEVLIDLMTVEEAALKNDVGPATIELWYKLNIISGIKFNDKLYILRREKDE